MGNFNGDGPNRWLVEHLIGYSLIGDFTQELVPVVWRDVIHPAKCVIEKSLVLWGKTSIYVVEHTRDRIEDAIVKRSGHDKSKITVLVIGVSGSRSIPSVVLWVISYLILGILLNSDW